MRFRAAASALALASLIALTTACDDTAGPSGKPAPPSAPDEAGATATPGAAPARLPDLVGMGLQSAQDKARSLGFHTLTSHDALGRGRNQVLDRNWKVCSQKPRPGAHPTRTKIDLGAVKLEETCPAQDEGGTPTTASATMPDFTGKSVKVARRSLDSSTGLRVEDASPDGRIVLVESNWQVCTQDPAPGAPLNGRPVTLTAVKFDEACP
ncbi:PASTA domain-containing protein [Streptomyces wuyuanensis]|uniref:PASTA domain-containing protein n=1 Tax=Streptomyces wuyuanensis TaxID=1196353 RepID=UPI00342E7F62